MLKVRRTSPQLDAALGNVGWDLGSQRWIEREDVRRQAQSSRKLGVPAFPTAEIVVRALVPVRAFRHDDRKVHIAVEVSSFSVPHS
jgi:hypothetical protein